MDKNLDRLREVMHLPNLKKWLALIWATGLIAFLFPSEHLSGVRLFVGSINIFFVPGLAFAGLFIGKKNQGRIDFLDLVAEAPIWSLFILFVWGIVGFLIQFNMMAWAGGILAISALPLFWNWRDRETVVDRMSIESWILLAAVGGFIVFSLGDRDSASSGGWEMSLQLTYIRQYFEAPFLNATQLGPRPPEVLPPNKIFFWEFLMAGLSRISGVDPLNILKCKFLIPGLGLLGVFRMVSKILDERRDALLVSLVFVLFCFMRWPLVPPAPLLNILEPGRGLSAFSGSLHHSDTAMEILLPFLYSTILGILGGNQRKEGLLFFGMLIIAFFWHPREFFQAVWFCPFALLVGATAKARLKRVSYLAAAAVFASSLVLVFLKVTHGNTDGMEEISRKLVFLKELPGVLSAPKGWLKADPFFRFRFHEAPNGPSFASDVQPYLWLLLAVFFSFWLPILKSRRVILFWLATVILWWFTLCHWNSQYILRALFYSEILTTKVRFIALLGMCGLSLGIYSFAVWVRKRITFSLGLFTSLLMGIATFLVWPKVSNRLDGFIFQLDLIILGSLIYLVVSAIKMKEGALLGNIRLKSESLKVLCIVLGVLIPVGAAGIAERISMLFGMRMLPEISDGIAAETKMSPELLKWLMRGETARDLWWVSCAEEKPVFVGMFTSAYQRPLYGNIRLDQDEIEKCQRNESPLFRKSVDVTRADLEAIYDYLKFIKPRYVLAGPNTINRTKRIFEKMDGIARKIFEAKEGWLVLEIMK